MSTASTPAAATPGPGDAPGAGAAAVGQRDPREALRTPVFQTLTAGWALTNFADSLLTLILAVWVNDLTGNPALAGATFAALGVPALASPFLGQLADRVSRKKLIAVAYVGGALVLVPLFWVHEANQVWIVYVVTVLYASVGYVSGACQSGLLRDLLPDEALGHANGRLSVIDQTFRVAMPFAGAAVYAFAGPGPLVAAAALSFAGAAAVFLAVRVAETPPAPRADREPYLADLAAGFRHLFTTQPLGGISVAMLVAMASTGLINAVSFSILDAVGIPGAWLGPLTVLQGMAGFAAGLATPRLMRRWGRVPVFAGGLVVSGLALLPFLLEMVWTAVITMAPLGFGVTAAVIAFVTERQIATPARLQGRTAAAGHLVNNFPGVVFTVVGAALLAVVDYRVLIAVNAVLLLASGVGAWSLRRYVTTPAAAA